MKKNYKGRLVNLAKSWEDERFAPECNFWLKEYQKRCSDLSCEASFLIEKERKFLQKFDILPLVAKVENEIAVEMGQPIPWNLDSFKQSMKWKEREKKVTFLDVEDCIRWEMFPVLNSEVMEELSALVEANERISETYGFSYLVVKRPKNVFEDLLNGIELIDWRLPKGASYCLWAAMHDFSEEDERAVLEDNTLSLKIDILQPRKVIDEQISYVLDYVIGGSELSADSHELDIWTTKTIAKLKHSFSRKSIVSRSVGLWLWDEVNHSLYTDSKRITVAKAIKQFEENYGEILISLDWWENKFDEYYYHCYRRTEDSISEQKVLSFSKKK
jgi:hypothetical protein